MRARCYGAPHQGHYITGAPVVVVGPGVGVAVRDGFVLPFRLAGWDCSMYSNFRESRVNVTGPWNDKDETIASGVSMSVAYLVCKADVHHSAKFSVCSDLLRYVDICSNARTGL